jgi:assimilatory nitrate reductase catalytic subunit
VPFQWPRPTATSASDRLFADGKFFTPDRKARFVPTAIAGLQRRSAAFPMTLNTGRVRDHWHTMTRTGKSPRLSQHIAEPFAEIHPEDARDFRLEDAVLMLVSSPHGSVLVRALLSSRQRRGSVFVPMHWTDQFASRARIDTLVPAVTDPHSGQPASKNVPVAIERFAAAQYGFAVLGQRPTHLAPDYWALARCEGGWLMELAVADSATAVTAFAASLFDAPDGAETLAYHDVAAGKYRFACFKQERLVGALFLARDPVAVSRDWACRQLLATHPNQRARMAVIVGRPGAGFADRGAIVCSCFSVGMKQIEQAIDQGCRSLEAIGAALKAGTNCGSCRSEIKSVIDRRSLQAAE